MSGGPPFPFGPLTPEEQAEREKRRLDEKRSTESVYKSGLPHLYAARDALREAFAVGIGGDDFRKVYRRLACVIEGVELSLRGPT